LKKFLSKENTTRPIFRAENAGIIECCSDSGRSYHQSNYQHPAMAAYLDNRCTMEKTCDDVEKVAEIMKGLANEEGTQCLNSSRIMMTILLLEETWQGTLASI
jgi:hypothetical protein